MRLCQSMCHEKNKAINLVDESLQEAQKIELQLIKLKKNKKISKNNPQIT